MKKPNFRNDKDQMHPEDLRNMFIFFVLAALIYFSYDAFILKPQRDAMKEQREIQAQIDKAIGPVKAADKTKDFKPRADVIAVGPRLSFLNDQVHGSLDLRGGRFDDLSLQKYFKTLKKKEEVSILNPRGAEAARSVEYGWLTDESGPAVPGKDTQWHVTGNARLAPGKPVTLQWDNGAGITFERRLQLDENFMFTITQRAVNHSGKAVTLYPYGLILQKGVPPDFQGRWVSYEGPIGYHADQLYNEGYATLRKEKSAVSESETGWIGVTDKYWLTAMVPPQGQSVKYSYSYAGPEKDPDNEGVYQVDYRGAPLKLAPGQSGESQSRLFVGAKKVFLLRDYEKDLNIPQFDLSVDFGWFWFMTKPFFFALHYLALWLGNMGLAIIVMTVILRAAVFPLTNTSYRSFAKMKKVSPIVTELREKYGDDKQKLQQELIEMYQREGVNPMSGCLPIMLQIPIFFALYKTFFVTIEIRQAPFFGWIKDLSAPDPTSVFNLFGLIDWDPPKALMIGVWPCMMLIAMIIQKKLNPPPQDPIQRDMANYMPFMFAYMMSKFAAGLVIYWTFSAVIGIIQQIIIMKSLDVPIHLFGETKDEKKMNEAIDKGPALHPLSEMAEDDIEDALFGDDDDDAPKKDIKPPKPKKSKKKKK